MKYVNHINLKIFFEQRKNFRYAYNKSISSISKRVAISMVVSLYIAALIIPTYNNTWFGYMAPFGVLMGYYKNPYQKDGGTVFERVLGFSVAFILMWVSLYILVKSILLFYIYHIVLIFSSIFYLYYYNRHKYRYAVVLYSVLIIVIGTSVLKNPNSIWDFWQFPVATFIGWITVVMIGLIIPKWQTSYLILHKTIPSFINWLIKCVFENKLGLQYWDSFRLIRIVISSALSNLGDKNADIVLKKIDMLMGVTEIIQIVNQLDVSYENYTKLKNCFVYDIKYMFDVNNIFDSKYNFDRLRSLDLEKDDSISIIVNSLQDYFASDIEKEKEVAPTNKYNSFWPAFNIAFRLLISVIIIEPLYIYGVIPGGTNVLVACFIGLIATDTQGSIFKLIMRIRGAIIGFLFGTITLLVVANTGSILSWTISIFLVFYFFAWRTHKIESWFAIGEGVGYSWIQGGLMYVIMASSVIVGDISLLEGTSRLEGALIGIIISTVIFSIFSHKRNMPLYKAKGLVSSILSNNIKGMGCINTSYRLQKVTLQIIEFINHYKTENRVRAIYFSEFYYSLKLYITQIRYIQLVFSRQSSNDNTICDTVFHDSLTIDELRSHIQDIDEYINNLNLDGIKGDIIDNYNNLSHHLKYLLNNRKLF